MRLGSFKDLEPRARLGLLVLAVLAPIAGWRYLEPALVGFGGGGGGGGAPRRIEPRAVVRQPMAELRMAVLDAAGGEYEPGRNIFRYGEKPKPPPAPPPPPPPVVTPPPVTPPPPPGPVASQPPPVDVSLLGIFGPQRRRIAVLTDKNGTIINALEREVIQDKFIIDKIGLESIDLAFVGFPDVAPQRLELGG